VRHICATVALGAMLLALVLGLTVLASSQGIDALQAMVSASASTRTALDLALRCAALLMGATVLAAAAASYVRE
jgi:hypothetical protein